MPRKSGLASKEFKRGYITSYSKELHNLNSLFHIIGLIRKRSNTYGGNEKCIQHFDPKTSQLKKPLGKPA
jgi:hypothetical protein